MSTDRDVTTRIVRSWLHEDAYEDADRILNLVLDEIDTTPQRRASWLARRFPPMNNNLVRVALVAAVLLVAVIVGANLLRQPSVGPSPTDEPSPAASPTSLTYSETLQRLTAGRYSIAPGTTTPAKLTVTMPVGWDSQHLEFQKHPDEADQEYLATFIVTHVYTDTCAREGDFEFRPIGATVDDLVAALEALGGVDVSPAVDTTVGGYPGKRVDISASPDIDLASCRVPALQVWANASESDFFALVPGSIASVYVIDVEGRTLAITAGHMTATAASDVAELDAIIASMEIAPPAQ